MGDRNHGTASISNYGLTAVEIANPKTGLQEDGSNEETAASVAKLRSNGRKISNYELTAVEIVRLKNRSTGRRKQRRNSAASAIKLPNALLSLHPKVGVIIGSGHEVCSSVVYQA